MKQSSMYTHTQVRDYTHIQRMKFEKESLEAVMYARSYNTHGRTQTTHCTRTEDENERDLEAIMYGHSYT